MTLYQQSAKERYRGKFLVNFKSTCINEMLKLREVSITLSQVY